MLTRLNFEFAKDELEAFTEMLGAFLKDEKEVVCKNSKFKQSVARTVLREIKKKNDYAEDEKW
ncbi:hypothetical protein IT568_12540 [bacterium]|nr:hypothetical protein [bacterium]